MSVDLGALAKQHLAGAAKFPPYNYSPMFRRALGQCGYGLHHLQGEEVVAIVNHSQTREEFMGLIITSFAVLARFGAERVRVEFEALRRAELHEGWVQTVIRLHTDDDEIELPILRDVQAVASFLEAAAGYRPVKRNGPVALSPTPEDPGCVEAFVASLGGEDSPEFAGWADAARRRLDAGEDAAAVRDTIARLHLLRLQLSRGRGMHDGRFLSPLRRADLAPIVAQLLPQPKEAPADLLPDPSKVKEQMQSALLEKAVGAAVQKTLGVKVDLDDILGDDTVEGRRFDVADGPATTLAVGAPGEAESTWGMIKSLARRVVGEGAGPGSYAVFDLQGRTGRRWKELASFEPNRTFELLGELELLEIESLSQPPPS